jgi:hypothetical protein
VSELVVPLLLLTALAVAILLLVAAFILRRFLLTRELGTFDCSLRREGSGRTAGRWVVGVARYESDRLDWFRIFTMSPRPGRSFARGRLVILDRREPEGPEVYSVLQGSVIVRCAYGASVLELAMSDPAYSGFATWLESAPPGQNINVA